MNGMIKKRAFIFSLVLICIKVYSQENKLYQTGLTAEQNLNAIGNLTPYTSGGMGFDSRYEGIKGSPRLFDTLMPSLLKIKGQDSYIKLEANIDLTTNSLIFMNPKKGKLFSIPSGNIKEVKIDAEGKELLFRTAKTGYFERDIKEGTFYQVLKDGKNQFIKIPLKKLIAADYKDVYSEDRRYDEFKTYYKYYIMSSDSIFRQIQLNKKSILKLFPDKKELINNAIGTKSYDNQEDMVMDILNKL
jgi:hypothetical protein